MLSRDIHDCPRCGAAIHRENYTRVKRDYYTDSFMLCVECDIGWEASTYPGGDIYGLDYHARTEPEQFALFVKRLEEARAA